MISFGFPGVFDVDLTASQMIGKEEIVDDGKTNVRENQQEKRMQNLQRAVITPWAKAASKMKQWKPVGESGLLWAL